MAAAVAPFREALAQVRMHAPSAVVFSCASAQPFTDPANELADALVSPVLWRQTMTALAGTGAGAYLDPGPGVVLAKLAPRCVPDAQVVSIDDDDLALVRAA
jgi:[acyl-carrier-protein] S-malonyltransferase